MGSILGVGSQRKWCTADRDLECRHPSRSMGWNDQGTRVNEPGHFRGNVVTAFSWFGVNMLGVGLHSYGFMSAAFKWLMIFNFSQIKIIAIGLMPQVLWAQHRSAVWWITLLNTLQLLWI